MTAKAMMQGDDGGATILEPPQAGVANLANALTVARLFMVPVFAVLLLSARDDHAGLRYAATAVFVAASLTDRVDGAIARRRGTVTDFGKIADPIADKALIGAALISLSRISDLPWWVTIVTMVREIGVTLLRFWVIRRGRHRGESWRQGEDGAAGRRDRSLSVAAHRRARVRAGLSHGRRRDRHVGNGCRLRRARGAVARARLGARRCAPTTRQRLPHEGRNRGGRHRVAARRHRERKRGVARSRTGRHRGRRRNLDCGR